MKRILAVGVVAVVSLCLAPALPAGAKSSKPKLTVSINSWVMQTSAGNQHVGPGSTFKHCAQNHVQEIDAVAEFQHAKKGGAFRDAWKKDGQKIIVFNETWPKKNGKTKLTLSNATNDLQDGTYKVTAKTKKGKPLASSSITLQTTGPCS
jgi:hypothetical protein